MLVNESNTSILLSVIIPVGGFPNGDSILKSWIEKQLPFGLEVILVLDCEDKSVTKNLQDIVHCRVGNKISLQVSHFRNPGSTREKGLKSAAGEWVCFWDADDFPEVENVFRNLQKIENQDADLLIGDYRIVDFATKKETNHFNGKKDPIMDVYLNPGLWRCVFKRQVVQNIPFPALKMGEDQVFLFRALNKSKKVKFVNENFYNYYQYPAGQLTKSNRISRDLISARNLCKELYLNNQTSYLLGALIRQNLTIVKRGTCKEGLLALNDLLRLSLHFPTNLKILSLVLKAALRG